MIDIVRVEKKDIDRFINFPDFLYKQDEFYVPYMKGDQKKNLTKYIFEEKSYTALMAVDTETKEVKARVLYTVAPSRHLKIEACGHFCMYECVDDIAVSNALLSAMEQDLINKGVSHISGSYCPFDPDNRRGILIDGFAAPPSLFCSYNKPYYASQLEAMGFVKEIDTFSYRINLENKDLTRFSRIGGLSQKKYDYSIQHLDIKKLDRDIADIHTIFKSATTEINFEGAPSIEELKAYFYEWKSFLKPEYISIARTNESNRPIGFTIGIPDYNMVFQKMRGKMDLWGLINLLIYRKRINCVRAMLQYVIPEYQDKGVIAALLFDEYSQMIKNGIKTIECGTIVEENFKSWSIYEKYGAGLKKRYRIFNKKLDIGNYG